MLSQFVRNLSFVPASILSFALVVVTSAQLHAQFIGNGGEASLADTSVFGQSSLLQNVTTNFDQIQFQITHVILEPTDIGAIRVVAQLVNLSADPAKVLRFIPGPRFTDEMGNEYAYSGVSGVNRCVHQRLTDGRMNNHPPELRSCKNHEDNAQYAIWLPTGVPATIAFTFAIPKEGPFSKELADIANYATLDIRFVHSRDNFETIQLNEVIVPNVLIPKGALR